MAQRACAGQSSNRPLVFKISCWLILSDFFCIITALTVTMTGIMMNANLRNLVCVQMILWRVLGRDSILQGNFQEEGP